MTETPNGARNAVSVCAPTQTVTTWYLEMDDPAALRPVAAPEPGLRIEQVAAASPEFSRFLYTAVGGAWHWKDRLTWSRARWLRHLDRAEVQTWVLYRHGAPAGYVELEYQGVNAYSGEVEISYFGLLPEHLGQRLGGHLLGVGIERAWAMGSALGVRVRRVWVHTCSLDAPAALGNYEARGMHVYRSEEQAQPLAATVPGPWPGWDAVDDPNIIGNTRA